MSMNMSNKDQQILEHIYRYCVKINNTVERFGKKFDVFQNDQDYIDSVSMNLLQIGELAGKFTETYVEATKMEMNWRAIKNMRNMFAHDYNSMDIELIWETVVEDIPELKAFCEECVRKFL